MADSLFMVVRPAEGLLGHSLGGPRLAHVVHHVKRPCADLRAAVSKLDSFVNQGASFWTGPGAEKFRSEWESFKPQAQKMIAAIQQDAPQAVQAAVTAIQQATGVS